MPRPKRTKVAPSAPAPRIGRPARSTTAAVVKLPASKSGPKDIDDISDPDEGLTKQGRHAKMGNGKEKAIVGRGRDGPTLADNSPKYDNMGTMGETGSGDGVSGAIGGATFDDIDLESSISSIEISRRETNTPAVENSRLSLANFRRRPRQPSILGRGPARARSSSIESNLAQDNGLTSVGRRNTSLVGNSRGRQRQTSISRSNAVYVAPSSMGLETDRATPAHTRSVLNLGNFRRRAREPSILGTGQKRQQARPDFDDDDEEEFNPDDESTPLNFNRTRNSITSPVAASSSSNPRKRKLSEVQIPRSSPSLPSPTRSPVEEAVPATLSDEEEEAGQESSQEELSTNSIESHPGTPEPLSETMAPPRSSSSPSIPGSPELPIAIRGQFSRPPPRGRSLRGRTPPPRTQDSPMSSPPSLTHSPNRPLATVKQRARKLAPPPSTFSTAQLQTLMPRRRRANRDAFDVPSSDEEVDVSDLASDDDELSHLAVRSRPRRPTVTSRTPAPPTRSKAKPVPKTAGRTYTSRAKMASDKENEKMDPDDSLAPLPDDDGSTENSQELEQRVGRELKLAARKFAEVDQWELDFEDVTGSSSSPRDAR